MKRQCVWIVTLRALGGLVVGCAGCADAGKPAPAPAPAPTSSRPARAPTAPESQPPSPPVTTTSVPPQPPPDWDDANPGDVLSHIGGDIFASKDRPPREKPFRRVTVLYGTDRNRTGSAKADEVYGTERGALELGICHVSIPASHKMGEMESPRWWNLVKEDPSKYVMLLDVSPTGEPGFVRELGSMLRPHTEKDVLVFVHGYNVLFPEAARRTAQLAYDLSFKGAPVCFSWPSKGDHLSYLADETTSEWAGADLAEFLRKLGAAGGGARVHVIAHSMGNRVLVRAMDLLKRDPQPISIQTLVLAAPDIDAGVFKRDISPWLPGAARGVTMYVSDRDRAIDVSRQFHAYQRAGQGGASVCVVPGIDIVDMSDVDTDYWSLHHSDYARVRAVIMDLFHVIKAPPLLPGDRNLDRLTQDQLPYWKFRP